MPRCTSNTVTVAPARTPPLWSVTDPRRRPALPCENIGRLTSNTQAPTINTRRQTPVFKRKKFIRTPPTIESCWDDRYFNGQDLLELLIPDTPPTCRYGMR